MGISTGLSAKDGRKFGLTVGLAFLVLGGIVWWRGREILMIAFAVLGGGLVLAGLIIPTRLGPVEQAWMRMAHFIAKFTTPVFMGVVYFLILTPIGALMRVFGRNPLAPRSNDSLWVDRGEHRRSDLDRQF